MLTQVYLTCRLNNVCVLSSSVLRRHWLVTGKFHRPVKKLHNRAAAFPKVLLGTSEDPT